jgi:hypothetical protein
MCSLEMLLTGGLLWFMRRSDLFYTMISGSRDLIQIETMTKNRFTTVSTDTTHKHCVVSVFVFGGMR